MIFRLYFKLKGHPDVNETFSGLRAMQFAVGQMTADDFLYINACMICDDKSEEIVYSSYEEIMNAKE